MTWHSVHSRLMTGATSHPLWLKTSSRTFPHAMLPFLPGVAPKLNWGVFGTGVLLKACVGVPNLLLPPPGVPPPLPKTDE